MKSRSLVIKEHSVRKAIATINVSMRPLGVIPFRPQWDYIAAELSKKFLADARWCAQSHYGSRQVVPSGLVRLMPWAHRSAASRQVLARGLFWLIIVDPIVLTVAYWIFMLLMLPLIGLAAGASAIANRKHDK